MTLACPQCKQPLTIPQPMPERMPCPNCRAVIKLAPAKNAAVQAPTAGNTATATAQMVAGYELQRELARGGLGVVYLAYHSHLKHYRAIKRPQPRADLDNEMLLARFRRETEALGVLESKHIIRAYDAGADPDGPYMVTEYLDGESLSSLVSRHRQLPISEACELVRQVALGLQSAHESGMVHRDIKPSNLMLTRATAGTARTVVIDWGLVKRSGENDLPANRLTKIHTQLGTPDYVSPEQIRDAHSVDIRADIYSLGATLYFLLAGQPPFHGQADEEKQSAQVRKEFPSLEQLRPDVPQNLLNILKKMVKKERDQRYQTPGELAAALQPFACAEPHRMLALLAPVPINQAAPNDTGRILDEKTQMAPARQPSTMSIEPLPQPRSQSLTVWLVAGAGLLIFLSTCILASVIGVGVWWQKADEPKKDADAIAKAKEEIPKNGDNNGDGKVAPTKLPKRPYLNEDFREAYEKRELLPANWSGNAYRVDMDEYGPCVQTGELTGVHWLKTPITSLKGDFYVAGRYLLPGGNKKGGGLNALMIRLESSNSFLSLPIGIAFTGKVSIGDATREAPLNFKGSTMYVNLQHEFLIIRRGNKVTVKLDDWPVGEKDLGVGTEFESVSVSLPPGAGKLGSRLYRITIDALDENMALPKFENPTGTPGSSGKKTK